MYRTVDIAYNEAEQIRAGRTLASQILWPKQSTRDIKKKRTQLLQEIAKLDELLDVVNDHKFEDVTLKYQTQALDIGETASDLEPSAETVAIADLVTDSYLKYVTAEKDKTGHFRITAFNQYDEALPAHYFNAETSMPIAEKSALEILHTVENARLLAISGMRPESKVGLPGYEADKHFDRRRYELGIYETQSLVQLPNGTLRL